jgi:hypothetical protein
MLVFQGIKKTQTIKFKILNSKLVTSAKEL